MDLQTNIATPIVNSHLVKTGFLLGQNIHVQLEKDTQMIIIYCRKQDALEVKIIAEHIFGKCAICCVVWEQRNFILY
jgi:hypothetical protein